MWFIPDHRVASEEGPQNLWRIRVEYKPQN